MNRWTEAPRGRVAGMMAVLFLFAAQLAVGRPAEPVPFRVGFSRALFADLNPNDAQAALKVWGQTVAKERQVAITPLPRIIESAAALREEWREGRLDAIAAPLAEFVQVGGADGFSHLLFTSAGGQASDSYVVLTHREEGRKRLADLAGCEVAFFRGPRMTLCEPWLDLELARLGLAPAVRVFGRLQRPTKLSKAVLPVFFRQVAAAIVDRRGFETMVELNPQLGRELQVIAASPPLISMVLGLRAGFEPKVAPEVVSGLREFHATPAGRQVLNLFQSDRLVDFEPALYRASLALLAEHRQRVTGKEAFDAPAP